MGEVKIANSKAGKIFLGDVRILGGVEKLLNELTIASDWVSRSSMFKIVVINISDSDELYIYRDSQEIHIPKQHIEWWAIDESISAISLSNYGNKVVTVFGIKKYNDTIITYKGDYENGDDIIYESDFSACTHYMEVVIIFNAL